MKAFLLGLVLATLSFGQGSYLGIGVMQVNPERAQQLKLPEPSGIEVTKVTAGSPADAAGLKVGDVITQFNGLRVGGNEQFVLMVRETPPGRQARLQVYRGGAAQAITVRIGAAPPPSQLAGGIPGAQDPRIVDEPQTLQGWRNPVLGVQIQELEPGQLAAYFGVSDGLLVINVAAGSAAARAGIKAGDVITGVGSSKVSTAVDITNRLRMMPGNSVGLSLMRDRQSVSLTVTFELQCAPVRGATC